LFSKVENFIKTSTAHSKGSSMAFRALRPYTILITSTGKAPLTVTIRPLPVIFGVFVLLGLPVAWISFLFYQNNQLAQQNETLENTANQVITEINSLDAEIEQLKNRAGISAVPTDTNPELTPQGGPANVVSSEMMFALAKQELPKLTSTFQASVKPALEKTLEAEAEEKAAFPDGNPLAGELKVSSEFGLRTNPFGRGNYEMHEGIDFTGPVGRSILATADGVVVKAEYENGYGQHVRIDHGYGYETLYAHLSDIDVQVGKQVKRGDSIGKLGNTGRSSGPHLHYGVYRDNQAVDPRYYLKLEEAK
jgi:murein DD-endopeptidase MepM/ murein hydrolase activator NlpD